MNRLRHLLKVVIIDAGGFGREVLDIFDACNHARMKYDVLGFIVEIEYYVANSIVNDEPVLGDLKRLTAHKNEVCVVCAIGAPQDGEHIIRKAAQSGVPFCSVIHPTAILTRWVRMGEGVIITAGCILTNQIQIRWHVQINLDCTIGHNAVLEDFATLAPGVPLSGSVLIGGGCYVGNRANLIENNRLGEWWLFGARRMLVGDVTSNPIEASVLGKGKVYFGETLHD